MTPAVRNITFADVERVLLEIETESVRGMERANLLRNYIHGLEGRIKSYQKRLLRDKWELQIQEEDEI